MRRLMLPIVLVFACNGSKDEPADTDLPGDADTDVADVIDTFDSATRRHTDKPSHTDPTLDSDDFDDSGDSGDSGGTGTWQPTPACTVVDPNEPNDFESYATPTGVDADGDVYDAVDVPLDGGFDDVDYYTADVPAGCRIDIDVTFDNSVSDVDLALETLSDTLAFSDTWTEDRESVAWGNTGPAPQTVYAYVQQYDDVCQMYDISMVVTCPQACEGIDTDESNGTPTTATPTGIEGPADTGIVWLLPLPPIVDTDTDALDSDAGDTDALDTDTLDTDTSDSDDTDTDVSPPPPAYYDRVGVPLDGRLLDHDLYAVGLGPGCGIIADVDFDPANGNVQAAGLDGYGTLTTSTDDDDDEEIVWFNPDFYTQDFYVDVWNADATCTEYDLGLEVVCDGVPPYVDPVACVTDGFEPNDDRLTATPTVVGGAAGVFHATEIGSDGRDLSSYDVYRAVIPAGCALYAETTAPLYGPNLDLELDDASGFYLGGSFGYSGLEGVRYVSTNPTQPTEVFLTVTNWSSVACTTYDLDLEVYCPNLATLRTCGADTNEPNESRAQAVQTGLNGAGDHFEAADVESDSSLASDRDFYHVQIPTGCALQADVAFVNAITDLNLWVWDANDELVGVSAGYTDGEDVVVQNTGATPLDAWVDVHPEYGDCVLYDIALDIVCP